MGLQTIPLSKIKENPIALRQVNKETEEYLGLVDSIKRFGVMNPITVRSQVDKDTGEEYYAIVGGLHRFNVATDAGKTDIPVNVLTLDEAETLEAQIVGNIHRIETKPVEYSKQLIRILLMKPMLTLKELANRLGKSTAWLSQRLSLTDLPPEIGKLVDEGKVKLANAYGLAKLSGPEEVANFLDRSMTMDAAEFLQAINARVKEVRDAKRQGREAKSEEFVPQHHLQKISEVKLEMERCYNINNLLARENITDPIEAAVMALKWVLHLDPISVESAEAKWKADATEREEQKKKRAEQRKLEKEEKAKAEADKTISQMAIA